MAKVKQRVHFYQTPEGLTLLEGWARAGLTMEQIAHNCGIKRITLYSWMDKYPEIADALKRGKEVVDMEVERALLNNALGYTITEQQMDDKGNKRIVKKNIPANVTAQIFWLKNRMPDRWRDRTEQEISGGLPVIISGENDLAD